MRHVRTEVNPPWTNTDGTERLHGGRLVITSSRTLRAIPGGVVVYPKFIASVHAMPDRPQFGLDPRRFSAECHGCEAAPRRWSPLACCRPVFRPGSGASDRCRHGRRHLRPDECLGGLYHDPQCRGPVHGRCPGQSAAGDDRYVLLTVRFEAADDKPLPADPWYILLQDTEGHLYEYADVPRPADALPPALRGQDLSAGDRVTGAVGFTVPTAAVIARVLYRV